MDEPIKEGFTDEMRRRLREIERNQAIFVVHLEQINTRLAELAITYKVLNDHHMDTQKAVNEVRLCQQMLETKLDAIKSTFFAGLTIAGAIIGIAVFILEYVIR